VSFQPIPVKPGKIDWISPSEANALLACQYRVALTRGDAVERRPNPFTAMGLTAHRLHELVAKGAFADVPESNRRDALEAEWNAQIQAWVDKIAAAWAPSTPPEPSVWPGIDLTRSRVIRALLRTAYWGDPHGEASTKPPVAMTMRDSPPKLPQVELRLEDRETRIYGILDRLESDGRGGLVVVDLKSGVLQSEMTAEQRRQLLAYAGLVRAVFGNLPTALCIEDAAGRRTNTAFTSRDVDDVFDQFVAARHAFNVAIDAGHDLSTFASPAADLCRSCSQRLACSTYWNALATQWEAHDLAGEVLGVAPAGGAWSVSLALRSPVDEAGSLATITHIGFAPVAGSVISATGLDETSSPFVERARWDSRLRVWPAADDNVAAGDFGR
jgi:RecB family exonuclease